MQNSCKQDNARTCFKILKKHCYTDVMHVAVPTKLEWNDIRNHRRLIVEWRHKNLKDGVHPMIVRSIIDIDHRYQLPRTIK
jgi:hypothetical protein